MYARPLFVTAVRSFAKNVGSDSIVCTCRNSGAVAGL
jgi:hypothetical protein